jgi:hypothetical protein
MRSGPDAAVSAYREYTFWSPVLGERATRLSVPDDRGSEFFVIVLRPSKGRGWREAREGALQAIEAAILRGDLPGEVRVSDGD